MGAVYCAPAMKLSVVIPVCNEADNVHALAREIQAALAAHGPFEIIFVDDGSTVVGAVAELDQLVDVNRAIRDERDQRGLIFIHVGGAGGRTIAGPRQERI